MTDDQAGDAQTYEQVVADRDALQARIDAYEGQLEQWEDIDRLIAESSLGTPEAVAHRERTPAEVGRAIVRASEYLARATEAEHDLERERFARRVIDQALMDAITERDRLRAVVDALREHRGMDGWLWDPRLSDDEASEASEQQRRSWSRVLAALDHLDAAMGGRSTEGAPHESDGDGHGYSDRGAPDPPNGGPAPPSTPVPQPETPDTGGGS